MSKTTGSFGTFFLPGPTEVRREILDAMTGAMMPHRGREFEELFARLQVGLRSVFRTKRPVFVSTSSATGLMEAGIRCAPPGRILSLVNGAFSARFADIATTCGRAVEIVNVELGMVVPLERVEKHLTDGGFAAVTVVHSETSTGALSDIRAISAMARRHGAVTLVDSVTGVAGAPLEFDGWELDYVLTGSQKALALPPGLAFAAASERFMLGANQAPNRGRYFDLVEFEEFVAKNQTPSTPAISLLYALDAQLRDIASEGIESRWARHAEMRDAVEQWAQSTGQRVLSPEGQRTPTVSAIVPPEGVKAADVVRGAAQEGYTIGSGYGQLRDSTYRIGHMGDHTVEGVQRCLEVCERFIRRGVANQGIHA